MSNVKCQMQMMHTHGTGACIETVHERGQGAYQFGSYYDSLCALQNSVPLTYVKANLEKNVLHFNADKTRLTDWPPILKSLRINKSLEKMAIHSFYEAPDLEQHQPKDGNVLTQRSSFTPSKLKIPPIHSKDLTYQLCKSVRDCLATSDRLKSVQLKGLPLRSRDIHLLSKGVSLSCCLTDLSLESSHIGDSLTVLCEGLKNASTVNTLVLSGCGLADGAVEAISRVVKHQSVMRHSEAWKSSLRYRAPDLDCMPGLRRITLNRNPLLGDDGAKALADALKDDLWLKAVDLQECGLTDAGAEYLMEALRLNSTVLVVDIRGNPMVSRALVERVTQQVMINSDGKTTQYAWLPVKSERKREIFINRSPSKRTALSFRTPSKFRTKLMVSPSRKRSAPSTSSPPVTPRSVPKQRGLPWRTAQRASVHKLTEEAEKLNLGEYSLSSVDDGESLKELHTYHPEDLSKTNQQTLVMMKELQAENISLKRRLAEESAARLAAEDRALESARENRRLQSQLRRAASAADSHRAEEADEELLSQVEIAFSKFNQFLDLVRDTGLEYLISEAGLDTFATGTSSPAPSPSRRRVGADQSQTFNDPSASNYHDYVLRRQIALQSDDILKPTVSSDSPKKPYSQIIASDSAVTPVSGARPLYAATSTSSSEKTKKKKERSQRGASTAGGVPEAPDLASGTYRINTFELKDVCELDTPPVNLSPRSPAPSSAAPVSDLIHSGDYVNAGPDSLLDPASGPAVHTLSASAPPTGNISATSQSIVSDDPVAEEEVTYSSNDFASVSTSSDGGPSVSRRRGSRGEVLHFSDPELSDKDREEEWHTGPVVSLTASGDDNGAPTRSAEMNNIRSLSELGSSVEDITS